MNITVYLPDEIGAQAKAAELNLSRLLRDAVSDELVKRATIARALEGKTSHDLKLKAPTGGLYIGRVTATMLLPETRSGLAVYLTDEGRVLVYDTGRYTYEVLDNPAEEEEALRSWLTNDDDYIAVMHQLGITPTIDLDL